MIPGDTSVKAAQLLAGDSSQDRIGEIIDLFGRGEADLRMGIQLGGKPGGPAFGRADAEKINVGHMGHHWHSSSESILRRNYSMVSRCLAFVLFDPANGG